MNEIHVNRAGKSLGTYTEAEVQSGLDTGRFLGADLAWRSGMENWKPLIQWADFTTPMNVPPPVVTQDSVSTLMPELIAEKNLPSWERKSETGFFNAFGATVKEVLTEPEPTFRRMRETGGLMTPFVYFLLASSIGVLLSLGVQFGMQSVFGSLAASQNAEVAKAFAGQRIGIGFAIVAILIFLPVGIFVGSFVGAGIWHLCLMLLGGATKPFEATYRVYCYVAGSTALVALVPCCGGLAAVIWKVVSGSIGLAQVHGISTGKAVTAVLLPLVLCCGICGVGIYFFVQSMAGNPDFMDAFNKALKTH